MPPTQPLFDAQPPGEIIKARLEDLGWSQEELALITGRSRKAISDVVTGRSRVSPAMAAVLAGAFGDDAAFWLKADALYQASLTPGADDAVSRKAQMFSLAPISEMQRRGWISSSKELDVLEAELKSFFGTEDLAAIPHMSVSTRRSSPHASELSISQRAWCFRARQLASTLVLEGDFRAERMERLAKKLRRLAAYPKEARHLPALLSGYGIRFVVVEPLPGAKIDGAAFWLDSEPVIAVSLRHDRIDGFWFTVMHEFSHIINNDPISIDFDMIDSVEGINPAPVDEIEGRANREAADFLVPRDELESFIGRVGPFYPRQRIIQFANRIKIHPGIIVGQLQHRKEIGYSASRGFLVKVREIVTNTALTDGWNQSVPPWLGQARRATK